MCRQALSRHLAALPVPGSSLVGHQRLRCRCRDWRKYHRSIKCDANQQTIACGFAEPEEQLLSSQATGLQIVQLALGRSSVLGRR
jgi:hypothetical protein